MTQKVLILGGSGKVGSHAAEAFWNAGWIVRQYNRKTDDMTKAAEGCDVIVNGLNPANYANWAENIPKITKQVIAAAQASGATVILPGNIYNFGLRTGALDENTPHQPNTRKGKIRVEMEHAYRVAGVQTIVLRAGNFICPQHNGDVMSMMILREAKAGKVTHAGTPGARQAFAYMPDLARAAVMLAEKRGELAQFEDVPFPGHSFTYLELQSHLSQATQRPFKLAAFPWWLMTMLSPFIEVFRELREMRYLYEMDHWISGEKFDKLLPDFTPTPLATVMEAGLPKEVHPNKTMRTSGEAIVAK